MEKKQIKVMAPEGFHFTGEVTNSEEGNTIAVVFEEDEPKQITWEEIIFNSNIVHSLDAHTLKTAKLDYYTGDTFLESIKNSRNYMVAYTRLRIIADYLNGDWKPVLNSKGRVSNCAYTIYKSEQEYISESWTALYTRIGIVLFKDKESCEEAIRIMGDELKYLFNY